MINELKNSLESWFGKVGGDEKEEEDFILGWVGCQSKHKTGNHAHGEIARTAYDKARHLKECHDANLTRGTK